MGHIAETRKTYGVHWSIANSSEEYMLRVTIKNIWENDGTWRQKEKLRIKEKACLIFTFLQKRNHVTL